MWREPLGVALTRQTDSMNGPSSMTYSTHKGERHAGTARGLHHLTGRLRGRGGLARMVGTGRTRVSRLARPAARTRLHDLDGSEHVSSDVRIRHRIHGVGLGRAHDR